MSRPDRSDAHLSPEAEAEREAEVREYFDDAAPKRHTKPSRSDHSAVYADALVPDTSHPELDKFQDLEAHTERLVCEGGKVGPRSSWRLSTTRISVASASSTTRPEQASSEWTETRVPRSNCPKTLMQRSAMLLARGTLPPTSGSRRLIRCTRRQTSRAEATAEQYPRLSERIQTSVSTSKIRNHTVIHGLVMPVPLLLCIGMHVILNFEKARVSHEISVFLL
ncbi:unnamed protein product [Urochloa humidicola]